MSRNLRIALLRSQNVDQAFPLVSAAHDGLSLGNWRDYASQRVCDGVAADAPIPEKGVLVVTSEDGYMSGLCDFHVGQSLGHGRTLFAREFLAVDLLSPKPVADALLSGIEEFARLNRCTAIHLEAMPHGRAAMMTLDAPGDWLGALLREQGHAREAVIYCKRLHPQAPAARC